MDLKPPFKYLLIKTNDEIDFSFLEDFFKGLIGNRIHVEIKNDNMLIIHNYLEYLNFEEAVNSLNSELLIEISAFSANIFYSLKELEYNCRLVSNIFNSMSSEVRYFDEKILAVESVATRVSKEIKELALGKYLNDIQMREILITFFKCNLNSSKAAQNLYMHRNTLLNKLDRFIEYTSYNVKQFSDAVIIFQLINN